MLCSEGDTLSEPLTGLYAIGGWLEADITPSMRLRGALGCAMGPPNRFKALETLLTKLKQVRRIF